MPTPGTVTLAEARLQAQRRADMENSNFVQASEWNTLLSNSYKELYDLLISSYGNDYFVNQPAQFTTDGTNDKYALPDGTTTFTNQSGGTFTPGAFYKLIGVDLKIQGAANNWMRLKPFNFAERNRFSPYGVQTLYAYSNLAYRIFGNQIWFNPIPQAGLTIQLWTIPEPATLSSDSDSFDGISGWEEYVIVDAAIKARDKEESDVSVLMAQKQALTARIIAMAEDRDAGEPATVVDSQGMQGGYTSPFGDPFGGW